MSPMNRDRLFNETYRELVEKQEWIPTRPRDEVVELIRTLRRTPACDLASADRQCSLHKSHVGSFWSAPELRQHWDTSSSGTVACGGAAERLFLFDDRPIQALIVCTPHGVWLREHMWVDGKESGERPWPTPDSVPIQ